MVRYLISPNCSDFGQPNMDLNIFPDGDSYIRIFEKNPDIVVHRLYPKQNTALFCSFLFINSLGKKVEMISPYLPYSRQDKIFAEGEIKSSELVCQFLKQAGVSKLITFDCHFLKKEGEFEYAGLKIKNISMAKALISHAQEKFGEIEVISPDQGASYMAQDGKHMNKIRGSYKEGEHNLDEGAREIQREVDVLDSDFDVKNKNVLIIDDMISGGGTMIKAIENVKKHGAKKVICAATHGFFLKDSFQKLSKLTDYLFVSDSIPTNVSKVSVWNYIKK